MKKLVLALAALSLFAVACGPKGPSAEEIEKMKQDSIRVADSLAAVAAAAEKAKMDSIRVADSIKVADSLAAVAKKGKKK